MCSPPLLVLTAAAALVLAGASAAQAAGPAVCNAKHKRPASPYGSVLASGLKPTSAEAGGKPTPVAPSATATAVDAAAKPIAVPRAELRASLIPCGDPA